MQLFKGCSIYINGYTDPPSSDLRRMILEYGGDYQHYCKYNLINLSIVLSNLTYHPSVVKKISVTHIIATNLTNSKIQEFRTYKVVKPEWITESVEKDELQPWQNYRLVPRSSKQKELLFQTDAPRTEENATTVSAVVSNEKAEAPKTTTTSDIFQNEWQKSVSTSNPDFIKRFYETSRLHHLSTWKSELKEIIEKLQIKYPKSSATVESKKRKRELEPRVVM